MIYPSKYLWVNKTLSFTYDDANSDGVWIQFKPDGKSEFITILQVEGSNPKNCILDPLIYGVSGDVQGSVKPQNGSVWLPFGGEKSIINYII